MKRLFVFFFALVFCLPVLSACGNTPHSGRIQVIATVFPAYDFARQVFGDEAEVTLLVPPGAESHSYEPAPQDIVKIENCDLFVFVGGESESWVDGILSSVGNPVKTVRMIDCVDALMDEHGDAYDEHVWTSPRNAINIVQAIGEAAAGLTTTDACRQRTQDYIAQLESLDEDFTAFFQTVEQKILVFGDRFPLRYFAGEYGLTWYAAFPGCSSESEPSASTLAQLVDTIRQYGIQTVFYIEFSNHAVADILAEETGAQTALFHTCHNVTASELETESYLSLMRRNLETLKGVMR